MVGWLDDTMGREDGHSCSILSGKREFSFRGYYASLNHLLDCPGNFILHLFRDYEIKQIPAYGFLRSIPVQTFRGLVPVLGYSIMTISLDG